ncbi:hypothetical protein FB45DRAFT_801963 [Roridomyces roridus]|uniref:DUF6699 domain-containing protein n=1 Tax=Roridomyces roridus TaxID=1738132 RepID=A0AAD7BAL0_9AGAR|nr:hypothetical protein FB45DRAFT_801963 [Roridomyces roridus]
MASPFIYVPEASPTPPHNPYYSTPQNPASPFLPPSPLFPSSPYLGSAASPPGSPNFNANSVLWPDTAENYESAYTTAGSWVPIGARPRTTSWHGPPPGTPGSPFVSPVPSQAFLQPQSPYFGHRRTQSFGASDAPTPSWANHLSPFQNPASLPATEQIHPWLNGDAPSPIFHYDLSFGKFSPQRLIQTHPPQSVGLSGVEIREPAFNPPRTNLRILHPQLPFWPIDLTLPEGAPDMPITLGDVLVALHRALHERISQADWETLSKDDETAVSKAFTLRCRAEAVRSGVPAAQLRDIEVEQRNEGVKKLDFLCGKTIFKGLVKAPGDPEGCVRLVTASK